MQNVTILKSSCKMPILFFLLTKLKAINSGWKISCLAHIHVTSFLSISHLSNSEYRPLKLIYGRKLWSLILDIHDSQKERPNFSLLFLPVQAKIRITVIMSKTRKVHNNTHKHLLYLINMTCNNLQRGLLALCCPSRKAYKLWVLLSNRCNPMYSLTLIAQKFD